MPTIKGGFSTKDKPKMFEKLKGAGVKFRMPFTATKLMADKNPLEGLELNNLESKKQTIKVK